MIYALDQSHNLIDARFAIKEGKYFCPHCKKCVILKQGTKKITHFSHARIAQTYCNKTESESHHFLKLYIASHFRDRNFKVDVECFIKKAYQYPDIVINDSDVIEIQFSQITIATVLKRTNGLLESNFKVNWIILNPKYNIKTKYLILTHYQRAFINHHDRTLYTWDNAKLKLYCYFNIYYLGGKLFLADVREISVSDLLNHCQGTFSRKRFKLNNKKINRYIKQCQLKRSVLEPTLNVIYNMRLQLSDICKYFGIIFPEQLYIKSHPIYWQLQLYYLMETGRYSLERFITKIEFNVFYINDFNKKEIAQLIVDKFKPFYNEFKYNNVQKKS